MKRRRFVQFLSVGSVSAAVGCKSDVTAPPNPNDHELIASRFSTLSDVIAEAGTRRVVLILDPGAALEVEAPVTIPRTITIDARGGLLLVGHDDLIIEGDLIGSPRTHVFHIGGRGRPKFLRPQVISPLQFGADAGGSVASDVEIRAAQDSIGAVGGTMRWLPGRYLCSSSIFLYGRVNWIAEARHRAEILVNGFENRPGANFLAVGVNRDQRAGLRWRGLCRGLVFRPGPAYDGSWGVNLVNVFDAEDFEFSHNLFEGFTGKETAFKGANQGEWLDNTQHARRRGRYLYNTINFDQGAQGSESISVSGLGPRNPEKYARDILIHGNIVIGGGDDAIAAHACENVTITGVDPVSWTPQE